MSRKSFEELGRSARYNRLRQLRQFILDNVENQPNASNENPPINPSFQENNDNEDFQMALDELTDPRNANAHVNERIMDEQVHAVNVHGNKHSVSNVNEAANVNCEEDTDDIFDVNGIPNVNINCSDLNNQQNESERPIDDHFNDEEVEDEEHDEAEEHEDEAVGDTEREASRHDSERNNTDEIRGNRHNLDNDLPLYNGAPLTVMQSMLMLLTILVKHNITMTCLDDLITVINLHCVPQGLKRNSLSKFKNTFGIIHVNSKQHFYCTTCQRPLQARESHCPLCPRQEKSYFVEMSIKDQLCQLYERRGFYEKLQHRIQRRTDDNISDIYDGEIYKKSFNNGFLRNPHTISLSWYTDGIPVFKSSQTSMWPIYLSLNELPFSERKKRENTLLLGLWCGKKPLANLFLHKLYPQLMELARGIPIFLPHEDRSITVQGIILMGTGDLIAKNDFMNFKQFNGYDGCTICTIKGKSLTLLTRWRIYIYPFQSNLHLRTLNDCLIWADQGTEDNPVMGIKGFSALSLIMPDYIHGMAIDSMHAVDGGVIRKLLYLFFDSSCKDSPFSLFTEIHIINNRLIALKPPKFVHRMPRSITDLLHWKASELKMWCFYYSIPVLYAVMRQDYFDNYLLLITAIALLSADNITPNKLNAAEDLIDRFVQQYQVLYGERHCAIVVHLLLHLVECVKRLGPLWAHTCFEYENINGQLLKHVHGTRYIESQVINSHDRCLKMVKLVDRLPEGPIKYFCSSKKKQVILNECIGNDSYSVGPYKFIPLEVLPDNLNSLLLNLENHNIRSVNKYYRLLKNKHLYVSQEYGRTLRTNLSVIQYINDNNQLQFGLLMYFIGVTNCDCTHNLSICSCSGEHYAVIKKFRTDFLFFAKGYRCTVDSRSFFHKCSLEDEAIYLISKRNIHQLCVFMEIDDSLYMGIPVNNYELE